MISAARPRVTLKLATSLDGRIAMASGESRWITGPAAREAVHVLRADHDAVMVGIGTALADDPALTVRLAAGTSRQPTRVVVDSHCRLPIESKLVQTAHVHPVIVYATSRMMPSAQVGVLQSHSVDVRDGGEGADGRVDLTSMISSLGASGVGSLLVEGGGKLAASLLDLGLVNRLEWFRAPIVLGDRGVAAISSIRAERLSECARFRRLDLRTLGDDVWESFEV